MVDGFARCEVPGVWCQFQGNEAVAYMADGFV